MATLQNWMVSLDRRDGRAARYAQGLPNGRIAIGKLHEIHDDRARPTTALDSKRQMRPASDREALRPVMHRDRV